METSEQITTRHSPVIFNDINLCLTFALSRLRICSWKPAGVFRAVKNWRELCESFVRKTDSSCTVAIPIPKDHLSSCVSPVMNVYSQSDIRLTDGHIFKPPVLNEWSWNTAWHNAQWKHKCDIWTLWRQPFCTQSAQFKHGARSTASSAECTVQVMAASRNSKLLALLAHCSPLKC